MSLDDITTVEERHLAIGLDPDLIPRVLRENRQSGDVNAKLASLGEFAYNPVNHNLPIQARDSPRHVPRDNNLSRGIEVARLARESRT